MLRGIRVLGWWGLSIKHQFSTSVGRQLVRHAAAVGTAFAAVSALIGLVALVNGGVWATANRWPLVTHGLYATIVLYLVWIILTRDAPDYFGLPKVRMFRSGGLLVVENVPWLSVGVMASIYIQEGELERLLCVGEVINVQSNGLVQIQVREDQQGVVPGGELWGVLEKTEKNMLLVKPGLFRSYQNV